MKISITTLGCKANQYDSACMEAQVRQDGWDVVPYGQEADAYIVNTCTVTGRADTQSRQILRRLGRKCGKGSSLLIATGCYAQVDPGALVNIPGVDAVLGLEERAALGAVLRDLLRKDTRQAIKVSSYASGSRGPGNGEATFFGPVMSSSRTRAVFKIQDGCDRRCSFCIVPKARGKSRSLDPEKVLRGITAYRERGVREVVLSGIHLGTYGHDLTPRTRLIDLLRLLRAPEGETGGTMRIRLSSLDPHEVTPELVEIIAGTPLICRHIHISLQSGDRDVLRWMNRPSGSAGPEEFAETVFMAKKMIPDLCIGTDVIAGFPAESRKAHHNTMDLLESLPVSYLHVFPYSRKTGTPAVDMPHHVPHAEITARAGQLRVLGINKRNEFSRQFLGHVVRVLVEKARDRKTGSLIGYTDNYLRVRCRADGDLIEKEIPVKLTQCDDGRMWGEYVGS